VRRQQQPRQRVADRSELLLLVLAGLSRLPRTDDWLMTVLQLTVFDLQDLLATARHLHLVDDRRRLTNEGHASLRQARSKIRQVRSSLNDSDDPYYPWSLRGVRAV
jgi:hypothetical protein